MSVILKKRKRSVMKNNGFDYDIALSFAGEDRRYVEEVAHHLRSKNITVFYDAFEETNLWGKNLYDYLMDIYQNKARYTVMFISKFYNKKLWTNHERVSMQARAFQESREYILPARFDDTEIPGILKTIGYISLKERTPEELASLIQKKLNNDQSFFAKRWSKLTNLMSPKPFIFSIKLINDKNVTVKDAKIVLIASNSTYLEGVTDENGLAHFVMRVKREYTVLVANPDYPAVILRDINPKDDIAIVLEEQNRGGSLIINKAGSIAGFMGDFRPFNTNDTGLSLIADNIAIEGGKSQPFDFELNKSFMVEDSDGKVLHLTFRFFQGTIALVDYFKP